MDGVTGVHSKLRDAQVPLKERIELCSHVFVSNDFFVPNKKQILADWLCNELHHLRILQGAKDGDEFLEVRQNQTAIWKLLVGILKSANDEHISLRQRFLAVLFGELTTLREYFERFGDFDQLTREACAISAVWVFACCRELLHNSHISLVLFNRLDNIEQCLKEVLRCFLAILYQSKNVALLMEEMCKLVNIVLQQYSTIQRQQVAQRKVFGNLCEKLLHVLLLVKYKICSPEPNSSDDWDMVGLVKTEIMSKIDSVVAAGLFHKDHVMSYKPTLDNTMSEHPSAKKPKVSSYTEQLFEVLRSSEEVVQENKFVKDVSLDWRKGVSISLPLLLESFLKGAKDETKIDRTVKFNFFIKLYDIISQKDSDKVIPEVDQMTVLNQMLQVLLDFDVYQIAEDNASNQTMFKWLLKLTERIMETHQENDAIVFQCLNTLLKLNHKILEHVLESVIERCLVKPCGGSTLAETEKTTVFCNVIETYNKLQQVEYLVKCMLKVIKKLAGNVGAIPVCILTKLSQTFEKCPINLTFILYKLFLNEMKSLIESMQSSQDELVSGVVMEVFITIFVTFLTNSSYNASDQHGLDQKRASSLATLLEDTKLLILVPLIKSFTLCKTSCKTEVGFCALYLLYGLNEVIGYLRCHDIIANLDNSPPQVSWNSELGTFIPDQSWDSMEILTQNANIKFCTEMLVAQKARYLMTCKARNIEEIKCCIHFLYDLKNCSAVPKTSSITWNGVPSSVTSQNYEVAHWCLMAKHAPLLIPHCNSQQVNEFAKCLIRTLVQHDDEESPQDHPLTVSRISGKLLKGGELHALPSAQTAIVKEFWELVGKSADEVTQSRFPRLANIFTWRSLEGKPSESNMDVDRKVDSENEDMECEDSHKTEMMVESLNSNEPSMTEIHQASSLAKDLAELMKDNANKMNEHFQEENVETVKIHDLQDIENLLNVLKNLPCSSFTPANQVRCLLGLLACDVVVMYCNMGTSLQLLCRHTLVALLQEWLQHRDYIAWRVVDMESLLAWLYATMVSQDLQSFCGNTSVESSLAEVSNNLLQVAVTLAVKSRKKASLTAIHDFSDQLLASIGDKIKPQSGKNLELVYSVVLACTQLLEQKLLNRSSVTMVCSVIKGSVKALVDPITLFLKEDTLSFIKYAWQREQFESLVLKLIGVLTKAIGFISRPGDATNESLAEDRLEDWGQVVALVFDDVIEKLENVNGSAANAHAQIVAYINVLEDISRCTEKHRGLLPDNFQANIFRLGLGISCTAGLQYEESNADESSDRGVLGGVLLRLFSTILEVNDGENCVPLLEGLVDVSMDCKDDPPLKLLTGLFVFKMLLSKKVVKKRKKDLRAKFGKLLVALLCRATTNVDVLTHVLEIIASVLILGNNALFPNDLALVFQALALARDVNMDKPQQFSRFFTARFEILSWTLYYYHDYVYGVIHLFLTCINDLLSSLLAAKSKDISQVLPSCAQKMSRLYQEISSHKDVFRKYATYFLADCVHLLSAQGIPGLIRETMIEGVNYLLDICDDDTLTKVHVYLPSGDRELFRSLQEDFNKHHKFKGNA